MQYDESIPNPKGRFFRPTRVVPESDFIPTGAPPPTFDTGTEVYDLSDDVISPWEIKKPSFPIDVIPGPNYLPPMNIGGDSQDIPFDFFPPLTYTENPEGGGIISHAPIQDAPLQNDYNIIGFEGHEYVSTQKNNAWRWSDSPLLYIMDGTGRIFANEAEAMPNVGPQWIEVRQRIINSIYDLSGDMVSPKDTFFSPANPIATLPSSIPDMVLPLEQATTFDRLNLPTLLDVFDFSGISETPILESIENEPSSIFNRASEPTEFIPAGEPPTFFTQTETQSSIPSPPTVEPSDSSPVGQISSLMSLWSRLAPPQMNLGTQSSQPGETIILPGSSSGSSGGQDTTTLIVLAIIGIVATIGAIWFLKKHGH